MRWGFWSCLIYDQDMELFRPMGKCRYGTPVTAFEYSSWTDLR